MQEEAPIVEEPLEEVRIQVEDPVGQTVGTEEQKAEGEGEKQSEEGSGKEVIISEDGEITFAARRNHNKKPRDDEGVREEDSEEEQSALKESQQKRGESEVNTPPNTPTPLDNARAYEEELKAILNRGRGSSEEDSLSYTGFEAGIAVHIKKVESNLEARRLAYDKLQKRYKGISQRTESTTWGSAAKSTTLGRCQNPD